LSLLNLILTDAIKVPVYGIDLPEHFVLSFHKNIIDRDESEQRIKSSLLIYINPFNKGIIF
ncbi:MAG TPA: transglutaminase family protein, partial [Chitinophagales bacterium]|nr:transglutaminase family protein [Chitinophagales bacterium]